MSKIEYKAKVFARRYIDNKFNGAKTVKELYNPTTEETARSIAHENLTKPHFKKAIEEELERAGLNDEYVTKEHSKVITQSKHLPSKNTAIDMYYKIKGTYAAEKKANLNITITDPSKYKEELNSLLQELKQLESDNTSPNT